jgi:hypothetical protein
VFHNSTALQIHLNIQLKDIAGKTVHNMNQSVAKGKNTITLPASQLSKGWYFINLISGEGSITLKIAIK